MTRPLYVLALCSLALCATAVFGQTDRGGIRGTVTDSSGAVVPGTAVTVTNEGTGISVSVKATDAGTYSFSALPSGSYRVSVAQSGFKTMVRDNVVVDLGNITGLDISLEVGASSQTVNVTTAAPILKTEQSSTSAEVSVDAFSNLPLSAGGGRSPQNFKYLTPGVNNNNSINGAPQLSGQVSMDGLTVQNAENTGADNNVRFPPEAVGEMSILTTAYSAEYGQTGGGVQRYTIKSGTNQYHGNFYEYLKNTEFDARGFFNKQTPIDRQNEFGFSIGGPVSIPKLYDGKNRSFFFFDADWFKTRGGASTNITSLPNAAFRSGDFSGTLGSAVAGASNACTGSPVLSGQIFDPSTTQTVNGQQCRTAFPGNIIPASRLSRAAQGIVAALPGVSSAILNNASLLTQPSFNNFNDYIIKGDQYFGSDHHLSLVFVNSSNPSGGGSVLPAPLTTAGATIWSWDNARATYDWIIRPTLLNTLRLGYNREIFTHDPTGSYADPGWAARLGIPGYESASGLFPGILWSPYRTLGNQQFWYATSNTYILNDSLVWTSGRHNVKVGAEYDNMAHALWKDWPAQFSFSQNETGFPGYFGSTGNVIASFMLGSVDSTNIPSLANTSVNYLAPKTFDVYAQDDYKITPRLTLNYGLRWSMYLPMTEQHNIYSAVDLTKPNPAAGNIPGSYVFAGRDGQQSCLSSACGKAFGLAPRLGLAWRLSNRFVVRSGYGISYFPTGLYGSGNNAYLTDGFNPTSTAATPDNGVTAATTLNGGFPKSQLQSVNLTPSYAIGSTFDYWSRYAQTVANVQSWNVSLQTQLAANLALDVAYVGSKGTHLTSPENINQLDDKYLPLGATLLNSKINSPAVVAAGFTPPWPGFAAALGANATLAQALRPYPQYLTGFGYNSDNNGNSSYHALQTKLEKRMAQGLYLLASFTWSKSITDANTTLLSTPGNNPSGAGRARDQYNRHLDKSVASAWQPLVFTTAFNYELPIGPGKLLLTGGGFAGRVFGGWHLGGILSYRSGPLISVTAQQTLPGFAGPNYASPVLGVPQLGTWNGNFDPAVNRYLNVNAFAVPTGYGTGGVFLPNLRGPAFRDEALSLAKTTRIKERLNLELRLETFNTFNRVIFGAPAANIATPQSFGQITTQANSPRNAQIAAKLNF